MKYLKFLVFTILNLALLSTVSMAQKSQNNQNLSDAEIASVALTANQIDVDYALIALKRSDNSTVRDFALDMVSDHTSVIQQATALAKELGVTPEDNDMSKSLLQGEKETTEKLKSKWGKDFDKAYIDNEVAYHKAVISAVKNKLIPQTENQQLKDLFNKILPVLEHHLQMAESAQDELK
ncbi:MAG TPA: DUF4142 domain-containing protein [Balneolaceae bacterium]|nr:DUF4142 domain-containing protein [Balneolaceae bacterium]